MFAHRACSPCLLTLRAYLACLPCVLTVRAYLASFFFTKAMLKLDLAASIAALIQIIQIVMVDDEFYQVRQ